jgi:hypothetical protein
MNSTIDQRDAQIMSADSKIGLLATIDEYGSPHISFLSSLQPLGLDALTVGQFCEGLSKKFMVERRQVGFLIFSPAMEIWRGRALYDRSVRSGPEFEMYNRKPMFRYNSYFGIGIVHYFKLVDVSDKENLSKGAIVCGALKTRMVVPFASASEMGALNDISKKMFSEIDGLKFISYIDDDGYPCLVPVIQAANAGRDRVVFSLNPYRRELLKIPSGADVAVLFVNLKMESVLVKGVYSLSPNALLPYGMVSIERVYNSMPPQPQYIYPRQREHQKVVEF